MKRTIVILAVMFAISLYNSVNAGVYINDEDVYLNCDINEQYNVTPSMSFSHVIIENDWVQFNTTDFNSTFDNATNITLTFLKEYLLPMGINVTIVTWNFTKEGIVGPDFNISGFTVGRTYQIFTNGTHMNNIIADGFGYLNFQSNVICGEVCIKFGRFFGEVIEMKPDDEGALLAFGALFLLAIPIYYRRRKKDDKGG